MSELLGRRLGQYELREVIRRGGMSTVYKAWQESLGRWVAVKVLGRPGDAQFAARFAREARSVAQLQHPNILPIYDYGQQDGHVYLVVQYVEGGHTLGDLLHGPMEPTTAVEIVSRLLAGVGYAHARGVIHRDVKPDNVLMPSPTWPMLTDFGVAKLLLSEESQQLTRKGLVIGTAAYMAPEQAFGLPVDARTDLYAVGVVLYELLTGQVPFDGENPAEVLMKQAYEPPPPPRARNPAIPERLEEALLVALAKDPDARYATAAEMTAALRAAAGLGGSSAAPPGGSGRRAVVPGGVAPAPPRPSRGPAEPRPAPQRAAQPGPPPAPQAAAEPVPPPPAQPVPPAAAEPARPPAAEPAPPWAAGPARPSAAGPATPRSAEPAPPWAAGPAPPWAAAEPAPPWAAAEPAPPWAAAEPTPQGPPPARRAPRPARQAPPQPQPQPQPGWRQAQPARQRAARARQPTSRELRRLRALARRSEAERRARRRALTWLLLLVVAVAAVVGVGLWLGSHGTGTVPVDRPPVIVPLDRLPVPAGAAGAAAGR